jgi:hypothetical protein
MQRTLQRAGHSTRRGAVAQAAAVKLQRAAARGGNALACHCPAAGNAA